MSTTTHPLVSIVVRSMDRPTLQRALKSAAQQTWPNLEIVVVAACGASHRPLPDSIDGRPMRLIFPDPDRRLARSDAANAGLEATRGEWINFLDDDDELLPHHVSTLLAAQRSNERIVYGRTRVVDEKANVLGHISHAGNHVQLYFHSRSTTCATLLYRSLIDEGARFDPDFAVHEDHDFQVNCATRTAFLFVDEVTSVWHAQAGESGCGFGANDNAAQRIESVMQVRRKWDSAFRRWLTDADAVLFAGQQYLKGGDFIAAALCFDQVLHVRPDDINAQNLGGLANLRSGNLEQAEKLLLAASQQLPDHAGIRENLRLVRARRGSR
jgi:glycosyltransferase involved in cell wall biosynthesis